jgi:hypothetical protein
LLDALLPSPIKMYLAGQKTVVLQARVRLSSAPVRRESVVLMLWLETGNMVIMILQAAATGSPAILPPRPMGPSWKLAAAAGGAPKPGGPAAAGGGFTMPASGRGRVQEALSAREFEAREQSEQQWQVYLLLVAVASQRCSRGHKGAGDGAGQPGLMRHHEPAAACALPS